MTHDTHIPSRCLNYVWLGLKFADGTETADILPPEYLKNINKVCIELAASVNAPDACLWLDYRRHSSTQIQALRDGLSQNITIHDLNDIESFSTTDLYQKEETHGGWRTFKNSTIWQQTDAVRMLVCLEQLNRYDQVFYADMDILCVNMHNRDVQCTLKDGGIVTSIENSGCLVVENQMFGFTATSKELFEKIYKAALSDAEMGHNGWRSYSRTLASHMGSGTHPIMGIRVTQLGAPAYHPENHPPQNTSALQNHTVPAPNPQ